MKLERDNNIKRLTGRFFEVLMIVFLFSSSYSFSSAVQKPLKGHLTVHTSPAAEIVFSHSDTSSEYLIQYVSKFQVSEAILSIVRFDFALLQLTNSEALFITPSLFNTFYTHLTAKAP
jgi:hypothetical protein